MLNLKEKTIRTIEVAVITEPDEGGFHAYAPALKGLHVDGKTEEEARQNVEQAVHVYLESLEREGEPLPIGEYLRVREEKVPSIPTGAFLHHVTVQCPSRKMSGTR